MTSKYDNAFYSVAEQPESMKPHNQASWDKLFRHLSLNRKLHYQTLVKLAEGHVLGSKRAPAPASFVRYCIRCGWLKAAI